MQCRYLKTGGTQCRGIAVRGQSYCHFHGQHRHPRFKNSTSIPLLEDFDSIQVVVSQVVQSALLNQIEEPACTLALRGLRIATSLLALRNQERRTQVIARAAFKRSDMPPPKPKQPEFVTEITQADTGDFLAPETEYYGPNGKPELRKVWSLDKILYNERLKKQGKPEIEYEDHFPEEGYLNREELIADHEKLAEIIGPGRAHLLGGIEVEVEADLDAELDLDAAADPTADLITPPEAALTTFSGKEESSGKEAKETIDIQAAAHSLGTSEPRHEESITCEGITEVIPSQVIHSTELAEATSQKKTMSQKRCRSPRFSADRFSATRFLATRSIATRTSATRLLAAFTHPAPAASRSR